MWQIFVDGKIFADSRVDELAVNNPVVSLEANKAGKLTFSVPPVHPYSSNLMNKQSVAEVYLEEDGECLFSGICSNIQEDFYKNKSITFEGELTYLNDSILRPQHYEGRTTRNLLEDYIGQHNDQCGDNKSFTVGIVTARDGNDSITCYTNWDSTMSSIKEDLVDDIGGYIIVRKENGVRYLDYYADSPRTCSQEIRLGENLINYSSNLDSTKLATVVIPLGARLGTQTISGLEDYTTIKSVNDGLDYLESENAIANFGRIEQIIKFDDVTTPAALKTKAQAWLSENQFENIKIEVSAIDLHLADPTIDEFKLLDSVRIISEPHGLNKLFTITKMTYNLNNPELNKITLGKSEAASMSAKTASIEGTIGENKPGGLLAEAVRDATALIKNGQNGYVTMKTDEHGNVIEMLIMDTKDEATATKIWRWNSGGLGYSDDGGETYALAMTQNGEIVADFITAGTIRGIEFIADGTVTRYSEDYTEDDVTRIKDITLGNIQPTEEDWEKYDINSDGIFGVVDLGIVGRLARNTLDSYSLECPIRINGSNEFGKIKTKNVFLHNDGISTPSINIGNVLEISTSSVYPSTGLHSLSIKVHDNGNAFGMLGFIYNTTTGGSGYDNSALKVLNGLVVGMGNLVSGTNSHSYRMEWTGSSLDFIVDITRVWSTSDSRLKKNIKSIDENIVDAIGNVDLVQYNIDRENYDDSILYFGATAQDIVDQFKEHDVDEEGKKLIFKKKIREDDEELYYGVDYEQFLLARIAYDEKKINELEARLSELERRVNNA